MDKEEEYFSFISSNTEVKYSVCTKKTELKPRKSKH